MRQTVDVSSAGAAINAGGVTYSLSGSLSGSLGGWQAQTDDADVTATFENAAGAGLGTATMVLGDYIAGNPSAPYENKTLAPMGRSSPACTRPSTRATRTTWRSTAGSAYNTDPDFTPGTVSEKNLADELNAAGLSWKGYAEGMNGDCDQTNHNTASGDYYLTDDEPYLDYADNITPASYCHAHNQPLTQMATDLKSASTTPAYFWIAANDYNDMERGGVSAGDTWLSSQLPLIFNSPAWTTQQSLLILTWDEGYTKSYGSQLPQPGADLHGRLAGTVKAGYTSSQYYDDYSLLATVEQALGAARPDKQRPVRPAAVRRLGWLVT